MPDSPPAAADPQGAPAVNEPTNRPPYGWWLLIAAVVVGLDQWSKFEVLARFAEFERLTVVPNWFDFTLVYNKGAAFSFLSDAQGWQRWFFTAIGLGATVLILVLLRSVGRGQWLYGLGLTMIMGGAIGNVIDRLIHHKVVDFLLVYQHPWYFPAFNLADSAITFGAGCLIVDEILRWRRERRAG